MRKGHLPLRSPNHPQVQGASSAVWTALSFGDRLHPLPEYGKELDDGRMEGSLVELGVP